MLDIANKWDGIMPLNPTPLNQGVQVTLPCCPHTSSCGKGKAVRVLN
jgi:hypothetical protein